MALVDLSLPPSDPALSLSSFAKEGLVLGVSFTRGTTAAGAVVCEADAAILTAVLVVVGVVVLFDAKDEACGFLCSTVAVVSFACAAAVSFACAVAAVGDFTAVDGLLTFLSRSPPPTSTCKLRKAAT